MNVNEAISMRILELCKKYDLTINGLATRCMLTQSTVDHIVNGPSYNPKILTIFRICAGLGITVSDFFDSELFNNINLDL